jgi:hypothetical protein
MSDGFRNGEVSPCSKPNTWATGRPAATAAGPPTWSTATAPATRGGRAAWPEHGNSNGLCWQASTRCSRFAARRASTPTRPVGKPRPRDHPRICRAAGRPTGRRPALRSAARPDSCPGGYLGHCECGPVRVRGGSPLSVRLDAGFTGEDGRRHQFALRGRTHPAARATSPLTPCPPSRTTRSRTAGSAPSTWCGICLVMAPSTPCVDEVQAGRASRTESAFLKVSLWAVMAIRSRHSRAYSTWSNSSRKPMRSASADHSPSRSMLMNR